MICALRFTRQLNFSEAATRIYNIAERGRAREWTVSGA